MIYLINFNGFLRNGRADGHKPGLLGAFTGQSRSGDGAMIPRLPVALRVPKTRGLGLLPCAAGIKVGRGHHAGVNHHPAGRSAGRRRGNRDTPIMGTPSPSFHWATTGTAGKGKGRVSLPISRARVFLRCSLACYPSASTSVPQSAPGRTGSPIQGLLMLRCRRLAEKRGWIPVFFLDLAP